MADNSDGSGSRNKPSDPVGGSKKPTPLLDLKATDVSSATSTASAASGAARSNLKGAPDDKPKDKPTENTASATPGVTAGAGKTAPDATASKTPAPHTAPTSNDRASAARAAPAGATAATAAAPSGSATGPKLAEPSAGGKSTGAAATAAATSRRNPSTGGAPAGGSPPHRKSGGGFVSTMSHLVAGVVGGGIALFAANPVSQQFGIDLGQSQRTLRLEQRLEALAGRTAGDGSAQQLADDVSKLGSQVNSARERLAKLETLGKQVADLAQEFKSVRELAASTGATSGAAAAVAAGSATPSGGDGDPAEVAGMRARLAKLENMFTTLSSATGGGQGNLVGIAPLAQFSAKVADLESSVSTQLGTLRKSLMTELDSRLTTTTNATAKAVAGADRLEREFAEFKTDTARLAQRSEVLKAASDKLAGTVRAIAEQAARLNVELDGLKGDLKQELAKVARPDDVKQALTPVSEKVASIEKNLQSVLASESQRKQNAERIVLSLELSNLKRVLDRGAPFAAELEDVKKIAGGGIDFAALEAFKSDGVSTGQDLVRRFRDVAYRMIQAEAAPPQDASRIDRLLAAAKSIVQVRRTDLPAKEKSAEAAVARIETHLKSGDMSGALAVAEALPDNVKAPAGMWINQLAARANVDRAISRIEDQLKASLGGGAAVSPDKKS